MGLVVGEFGGVGCWGRLVGSLICDHYEWVLGE